VNPDVFDVRRADRGHIGFAHGIHYCLGAPLARMELEEAFAALIERDFALAVPPEQLSWRVTPLMRGLSSLPVHVAESAKAAR
jgi:pikromycin synthase